MNYKMREDSSAWFLTASPSNYYESEMKEDELKDITVDNEKVRPVMKENELLGPGMRFH